MRILIITMILLFIYACENTRQSIGLTTKPLSENYEQSIKMNYKIVFGQIRSKKTEDDDD